ncbi:hypothetical protein HDU88_007178, partial [Geranomyces variabilis]
MTTGEELTHTTDTSRPVTVGSRLCVAGHFGTVRFRGPVPAGSDAIWLGVEWDDATRGKHSGTHGGVSYFQTTVAGSGTFLRESKVGADMLPRSLLAAMQEKYLAAQPTDSVVRLGGAADGVEVETVGWEKIARKVKDGSRLKEVGVADMRVGFRGGEQGELGRRFPAIVDLDLSRSLLVRWSDVAEICAELPQLASLRLAHNRFASIKEDRGAAAQRFLNVKALTLHHTETPWAEMEEIAALFPVLKELHFGFNRLDASPFDAPRDSFGFAHLRLLNLEYNNLTSWSAIKGLGQLPCLTALMLNGNAIQNVEVPASNEFASLTTLNISDNQLSSWAAIHALNGFPTLTIIRLQRNPILDNLPPADARSILTARLANATVLNGAEITERFRRDAELFYLSLYAKDAATEDPASFARTHPRHAALVALHGAPAIAPASATSTILKDRVLTLSFVYGEKSARKKVPINMGIRPLKVLVARVFKIPDATALVLTKIEEGGGDVELDDDLRDVDFYGVESGNKIRVGLYTDIVTLTMSRRRRRSFNLQSLPRTPPLGSPPPPPSKRQRWNEEAARHAAIFVGDAGAQLDEVEVDAGAQLDEAEVDARAMELDEVEEVDAGAMQLDEVEEVDAYNSLRWRAPQRWANSHGPPPPPLPPAERAKRSLPSNYVCVKARFGSIIHNNKAGEVARLQVFLRHVHLITQRASWIVKLWYANMPHPEILTDNDVKHLLNALNYAEITRGGIFQGTLDEYDTNVETLTAVSQGPGCGRSYLQHMIAYTATSLVTNLEVNVSVNFMKKLRQYVEHRFRIKLILRSFNHVTDKRIRKFLCKRLRRRFKRMWRLITNQDVLADGKLPAFEPASDSVFFDIWGEIWCILPDDLKRFEFNLAYAVACKPAKYIGA